jgi:hypothetical protein
LPEGPANVTVHKCVDLSSDASLAEVNPKYRMQLVGGSAFGSVMCIAVDNNPVAVSVGV